MEKNLMQNLRPVTLGNIVDYYTPGNDEFFAMVQAPAGRWLSWHVFVSPDLETRISRTFASKSEALNFLDAIAANYGFQRK